ncbi:UNVERIFIED_CONTAM: hypothetical protein RMT77_001021 [Armadillidium vulgare]
MKMEKTDVKKDPPTQKEEREIVSFLMKPLQEPITTKKSSQEEVGPPPTGNIKNTPSKMDQKMDDVYENLKVDDIIKLLFKEEVAENEFNVIDMEVDEMILDNEFEIVF